MNHEHPGGDTSAPEARWSRLEALLARPARGRLRLTPDEVAELARLYRQAASDLGAARRGDQGGDLARYLNDLVLRAHGRVYAPGRGSLWGIIPALWDRFPALVSQYRRAVYLATALFLGGAVLGFVAVMYDPNLAEALVPEGILEHAAKPLTGELAPGSASAFLSTAILTNNIKVGILAFGLGLTFGIGTTYVLLVNGVMLGALSAIYHREGRDVAFWATILPHGVIELTAIFLSGAAGFILAGALIRPGTLIRRQALTRAAGPALGIVLGTIPMYIVAGFIEGFLTPRSIPHWAKLAVAGLTAVALIPYLVRRKRPATAALSA